jgi:hypothetical protein
MNLENMGVANSIASDTACPSSRFWRAMGKEPELPVSGGGDTASVHTSIVKRQITAKSFAGSIDPRHETSAAKNCFR